MVNGKRPRWRAAPLGILSLLVLSGLIHVPASAERYALDPQRTTDPADFRVELRQGVELRFDGATQLSLSAQGQNVAQFELGLAPPADASPLEKLGGALQSELYHWRYYHVDGVAFWQARANVPGDPLLINVDGRNWEWSTETILAHVSVGKAHPRSLRIASRRLQDAQGEPIYIGLLRLDGAAETHDGSEIRWPGAHDWPLAVFVADTRKGLLFLAGQAQWTYDEGAGNPRKSWAAPPMCARCRNPQVGRMDADFMLDGEKLRIAVRFEATAEPALAAAEGLRLDDRRMGDALLIEGKSGATYELDTQDPDARRLARAAAEGNLSVMVEMATGLQTVPQRLRIKTDAATRAWLGTQLTDSAVPGSDETAEERDQDLPDHLSPSLLQSWPNPFRERTTIEITVPSTLGEAFELDEEKLKVVDPGDPVPFGGSPVVRVRVYNVGGQLIRLLSEETRGPGRYSVGWDGKDLSGRPVAAGAYYVNVEIGEYNVTQRVLRLRG